MSFHFFNFLVWTFSDEEETLMLLFDPNFALLTEEDWDKACSVPKVVPVFVDWDMLSLESSALFFYPFLRSVLFYPASFTKKPWVRSCCISFWCLVLSCKLSLKYFVLSTSERRLHFSEILAAVSNILTG